MHSNIGHQSMNQNLLKHRPGCKNVSGDARVLESYKLYIH